jgi:uncharacterized protein
VDAARGRPSAAYHSASCFVMNSTPPRLLPDEPLPPYAYVPGRFPHPFSDPAGHSYQRSVPKLDAPDPIRWRDCRAFLHGLDLFNHGYYWEAHEAWEALWHACGRQGLLADFFKGLIQLAVAGVKVREGKVEGVRSHAARAAVLFQQVAMSEGKCMGLALADLAAAAGRIAQSPPASGITAMLPLLLVPHQAPGA